MIVPPQFNVNLNDLPSDVKLRHEALVDVFGQYLFWARKAAIELTRRRVEVESEREPLGRSFQSAYDDAATLTSEDREKAYSFAQSTVDVFAKMILTIMAGQGFDDRLGPDHVFRLKLVMEICSATTGELLFEDAISRDGRKFFPEYWGRWLNRFADSTASGTDSPNQPLAEDK